MTWKRRRIGWLVSGVLVLLTASFAKLPAVYTQAKGFNLQAALLYAGVLASIVCLFLWQRRSPTADFLVKLQRQWAAAAGGPGSASIDSVTLSEGGESRQVPPELLLAAASPDRILALLYSSPSERDEIFARLARTYVAGLSKDVDKAWTSAVRYVPLLIDVTPEGDLDAAVRGAAATLVKEKEEERLDSLMEWLRDDSRLLVLADLGEFTGEQFAKWYVRSADSFARLRTVIAVPANKEFERRLGEDTRFAVVRLPLTDASSWVETVAAKIDFWCGMLEAPLELSNTEVRQRIQTLATTFVLSEINGSGATITADALKRSGLEPGIAERLTAWIEVQKTGAVHFRWIADARLVRDHLMAAQLDDAAGVLDREQLEKINRDPRCAYVRPLLELWRRQRNSPDHALSEFPLCTLHVLALLAWDLEAPVQAPEVSALRAALADGSVTSLDWTDLNRLLPRFVKHGGVAEFRAVFAPIPAQARVASILQSGAQGAELGQALKSLTTNFELWQYFDSGGRIPSGAIVGFAAIPDIGATCLLAAAIAAAPHACPVPAEFHSIFSHPSFIAELRTLLAAVPFDEAGIDLCARRVAALAREFHQPLNRWLPDADAQGVSPQIAKLAKRAVGYDA